MKHPLTTLTTLLTLLLLALGATACHRSVVYDDDRIFEGNTWNRFTNQTFDIQINNIEDYYNIDFTVDIDTLRYRYDEVPFIIELTSPGGEQRQFYGQVPLREKGRWRGEMNGDYRTVSGRIRNYFSFNTKGHHKMDIRHTTSQYDLEGIHRLNVTLSRAKLDYDL